MNILFIEDERVSDIYNQIAESLKEHKFKFSKKENLSKIKCKYDLYLMFFNDIKDVLIYKEKLYDKNILVLVEQAEEMMIFNVLKYINVIDIIYINIDTIHLVQRIKSNIQMLEEGENEKVT